MNKDKIMKVKIAFIVVIVSFLVYGILIFSQNNNWTIYGIAFACTAASGIYIFNILLDQQDLEQ